MNGWDADAARSQARRFDKARFAEALDAAVALAVERGPSVLH
jgi:hypothetical protein